MAQRGTPLPFAIRQQIQDARQRGATVRTAAAAVGVSKSTVQKYARPSLVQNPSTGTANSSNM